jgi:CubicO group peptidase (beta-lactamase class C family)
VAVLAAVSVFFVSSCGGADEDRGRHGGAGDENADVDDAYSAILDCTVGSPNYSFTLSDVPICAVDVQPVVSVDEPPVSTEVPDVDGSNYSSRMNALFGKVMGYAWVLVSTRSASNPGIVIDGRGGVAWRKPDPAGAARAYDFTSETLANVGSVTKVFSGVTFLHMFEALPTRLNPDGINLETFLGIPFLYFLPRRAQEKVHHSLALVTVGDLLRHTSGLVRDTGEATADFENLAIYGSDPDRLGVREYNNMNSLILRYLIPFIGFPSTRDAVNDALTSATTLDAMSEAIDRYTRARFTDYVENTITPLVGGDFTLSCMAAREPDGTAAMMFPTRDYAEAGYLGDFSESGGCSSQSGNWFSARGFASFLVALGAGNLISEHARRLMSDERATVAPDNSPGGNRLIWAQFGDASDGTYSEYIDERFGDGYLFGHGGDDARSVDGAAFHAHAGLTEFPWGYYGFVVVNSGEFGSNALMVTQRAAFEAALGKP